MADKENSACASAPRLTRAAAKRAAAVSAVAVAVAAKRKRVALSEIPTLPNSADHQAHSKKPRKSSSSAIVSKPKKTVRLPSPKPAADETGDPQLCAPYASDIYSYLRSMEVRALISVSPSPPHRFHRSP
jgi:cyclin A